jgi:protein gp37
VIIKKAVRLPNGKAQYSETRKSKMGENSKIEWTDHTFNPWTGCTKVSPGCDHCYAESWSKRSGLVQWGNHARRRTSRTYWRKPLKWNAQAQAFKQEHGHRPRVFCASLADVFDNQADPAWRKDLFGLIRECDRLDWLLLTKRPQNIAKTLPADWGDCYHNVWLGITAEDQSRFNQRWPILQPIPAVVKFVSYEPAIGPLRLPKTGALPDWLISGGESGGGARPMNPQWARDILFDCLRTGVAPFHKQWGTYGNNPLVVEEGMTVQAARIADPYGKGGGLINGELVREYPNAR